MAYETAVDVVTEKVIEETHNADFDEIEKLKESLTSDKSRNSPKAKSIISQTLDLLMKQFRGMTGHISERLRAIFRDPAKKKEMQEPIRESILDKLAKGKISADVQSAQKRAEQRKQERKQQSMER